jgi:hypothetical protein
MKRERERAREKEKRKKEKEKRKWCVCVCVCVSDGSVLRDIVCKRRVAEIFSSFEGSQAEPARPSSITKFGIG